VKTRTKEKKKRKKKDRERRELLLFEFFSVFLQASKILFLLKTI